MSDPDPRGLVREAFRIEGITPEECRSIFLDWAMATEDVPAAAAALMERHGQEVGHPMLALLAEARAARATPARRGGRRGRPR